MIVLEQESKNAVSIDDDGRVQHSDSQVIPGILALAHPALSPGSRSREPPTPFSETLAIWKFRETHRPRKFTEGV